MDDSCAVCADNLEWVAYGSCGHREVCSTCVVRLRFVLCDPRCCICKTESPLIFVTKALGDYTRTINDFSTFPTAPKEGRVAGGFWYHEDTQAFFDDLDQYRMIKAMCRLSCSVCDKAEEEQGPGPRHRLRIKSVEQLKGHLYHKHKLNMCNLCLEGRKIFIGEQKLYTRAQLNQHIHTGDSEVDGSESERGGFAGHPMCEFCRNPFYGDNELYTHMTTEHYTCHICQRSQTGKYEYYKNYDDLELHFRRDHFLCEDDSCLSKKFIVFPNESELKRHNAIEHGGRMSRAQRTAALQIPTSFRYSRGNDQESRRGRPRSFRREPGGGDDNYNRAVNAALRLSEAEYSRQEPPPPSSAPPPGFSENNNRDMDDGDPLIQPMESLSTTDMEPSSRYLQAVGSSGGGGSRLQESAFPPLAGQPRSGQNLDGLPTNTLAARLRRQTNRTPSATAIASPSQAWPAVNRASNTSGSGGGNPSSGWPAIGRAPAPVQASSSSAQSRSHARVAQPRPPNSQAARNGNMIPHSSSAPNLSDTRSLHSEFPPVSAAARKTPSSTITQGTSNSHPPPPDVQSANKSLVEQMRSALGHDEELFMTFKDVSGQYRQGSIDATTYLEYVKGYGLSHLVIDLARLCPDPRRQKELIDAHTASLRNDAAKENGPAAAAGQSSSSQAQESKKNKGKAVKVADPKEAVADNFMETVRRLQFSQNFHEEEEEVISKDKNAYRSDKGKSKVESTSTGSKQQRKKTSKFHRVRLGDGSMAALLNVNSSYHEPHEPESKDDNNNNSQNQTGVRGVWRKGGAQLFS